MLQCEVQTDRAQTVVYVPPGRGSDIGPQRFRNALFFQQA